MIPRIQNIDRPVFVLLLPYIRLQQLQADLPDPRDRPRKAAARARLQHALDPGAQRRTDAQPEEPAHPVLRHGLSGPDTHELQERLELVEVGGPVAHCVPGDLRVPVDIAHHVENGDGGDFGRGRAPGIWIAVQGRGRVAVSVRGAGVAIFIRRCARRADRAAAGRRDRACGPCRTLLLCKSFKDGTLQLDPVATDEGRRRRDALDEVCVRQPVGEGVADVTAGHDASGRTVAFEVLELLMDGKQ
ncbi:hypothetical protein DENSPDRAFT_427875 [Dentipellis sp. KUC8613]|nr:hypothetical protein DENSPDRAFT_427875 [Dentipellis sp. KUC8613]